MNWHRLLLIAGIGTLALGVLALVAPGAVVLGGGQPVLSLVGVLALLQAFRVAQARRRTDPQQASTAEPERTLSVPTPGQTLDDALGQFRGKPHAYYRHSAREGLRGAALTVLTRYANLSESEASERLEQGTWTDDRYAAAFLDGGDGYQLPLPDQIRTVLGRESPTRRGIRRSIDAIATVASVPHETNGEAPSGTERRDRSQTGIDDSDGKPGARTHGRPSERTLPVRRQTEYWTGISAVALLGVGVGVLAEQSGILLVGVVGIFFAAYTRSAEVTGAGLSLERSVSETRPEPDEPVEVTVTVTNDGPQTLPDVRLVDGVPGALSVTDGSPRLGTVLRPGDSTEFSYTVTARRGVHEFGPMHAIVRNRPGTVEYERAVATETPTTLTCVPTPSSLPVSVPLRDASTPYTGIKETATAGDGTEFYATRLYQPGDSMSRIDWNRQAKTGEFATLLFREERRTSVVFVFDTTAYLAPEPHAEHALDRSVAAAGQLFETIQGAGHFAGIATLGRSDCWLSPGTGTVHRTRARELLATHPALQSVPSEHSESPIRARRVLRSRLPADSQVFVFSPLGQPSVVRAIRRLEAADYPVTVVSPDPTAGKTPSQRLARVARRVHITDLRTDGIPVLDWAWDEPLETALARFAAQEAIR